MIDADALYERTAEWEAWALAEVEKHDPREDREEWQKWTHILNERTAFKHDVADAQTIDAVPRQKYEEEMENAFAHGYTDAESKYRKMIADGELVEVVRCKDCIHQQKVFHKDKRIKEVGYYICGCELADGYSVVCLDGDFCSRGKRRSDEQT